MNLVSLEYLLTVVNLYVSRSNFLLTHEMLSKTRWMSTINLLYHSPTMINIVEDVVSINIVNDEKGPLNGCVCVCGSATKVRNAAAVAVVPVLGSQLERVVNNSVRHGEWTARLHSLQQHLVVTFHSLCPLLLYAHVPAPTSPNTGVSYARKKASSREHWCSTVATTRLKKRERRGI